MVTIRNGQGEALPRHRGFKSAIRNVARFSFQSADRCKVKDFLRVECVSIDVRLLKCTRICRNPRDNGTRICPMLLLCMAYYNIGLLPIYALCVTLFNVSRRLIWRAYCVVIGGIPALDIGGILCGDWGQDIGPRLNLFRQFNIFLSDKLAPFFGHR